ncbi:unnamed protein product [Leptidea sinapis]|uniref:Glucose-methanol-choline oxidoreductase N-terminal domain-containing protein n=1 Tax=Leptidea sinapis TaxID=189913 RepID=A0A5E4QL18_9NEOP|nr:unnamed protein product [Leptidea sinapis]
MCWIAPDITPVCAATEASLTQCSPTGFMYLSLLMQLFGNSSENSWVLCSVRNVGKKRYPKDDVYIEIFLILLIEAGPEEPDITMVPSTVKTLAGSNIDWKGKTLGGSSAINYMVYMRGNKLDYDGWAAAGNPGWSYDEVLPYFKKSENNREATNTKLHGISGPLSVVKFPYIDNTTEIIVESFKEKGLPLIDLTSPNNLGVNIAYSTSENGKRQSANAAFIKPIRQLRSNLQILTDAFATKILIDPTSKTAFGIKYQKNGIFFKAIAKKEVIISSGTYNSPKLLMLSGIGHKEYLENLKIPVLADLQVGYNLQDHVSTSGLVIALSDQLSNKVNRSQLLYEVNEYYKQGPLKHGPLTTTSVCNTVAFIKTNFTKENAPDIQYHFIGEQVDFFQDPASYLASNIFPMSFYDIINVYALLLDPKSRGIIKLNATNNIFGPPLIYPGFFQVKEDMDRIIEGMKFAVGLEETIAFKSAGISFDRTKLKGCQGMSWGSYDYFACLLMHYTTTIGHPVGTCKMGPKADKDAVVDAKLRVHGIKNLRVIDASVMPKITRGNTNAPTIMIAEKGSDMIKNDHEKSK